MSWKRMILGDKMPDKDDPKYQKRYEKEVSAGRKMAERLHVDVPFRKAQEFAIRYPAAFLSIVFGFVIICFCMNVYRMSQAYASRPEARQVTATERQEQHLQLLKDSVILRNVNNE